MIPFLGNRILSRLGRAWCRLAMAARNGCYMVEPTFTFWYDGRRYDRSNTETDLIASAWPSTNDPCGRRTNSRNYFSCRKYFSISRSSYYTYSCPDHRGLFERRANRPHSHDNYRSIWFCPDETPGCPILQHSGWLPFSCDGSNLHQSALEFNQR